MRPHPASSMSGSTAWIMWKTPLRLTSITRCQSANSMWANRLNPSRPAALTRTVTGPSLLADARQRGVDLRAVGDVGGERQTASRTV